MDEAISGAGWKERALRGSPDFLNDLRDGAVTWSQLWAFYRQNGADPGAVLALMGFFHVVMSRQYEREGSLLDVDGRVYPELCDWARFVVANEEAVPEEKLRDSLAGLLGLSLVSPLYYELVFSLYLEASLERQVEIGAADATLSEAGWRADLLPPQGQMAVRLPERARCADGQGNGPAAEMLSRLLTRHYPPWDAAYTLALGRQAADQFEEGGEG